MLSYEDLQARREARSRRRMWRRRRRRALGAIAIAALVAGVVLGAEAGSHRAPSARPSAAGATPHLSPERSRRRRGLGPRHGLPPGRGRDASVPILMYHVIAPAPIGARFPGLYVGPEEFAAQMRALYRAGFTAVTLDQVREAWMGRRALPDGRPVVLSFDNGYESHFNAALPVLRRLHWAAVENIQLSGLPRDQGGLSHEALRRLLAAGWELDTQGYTHADLVQVSPRQLEREVVTARRVIRRRWHVPVNWFCYPSGRYDRRVLAEVRAAGYVGATTVEPGWARAQDDPYRLPRLRVLGGTTPAALLAEIARHRRAEP